MNTLLFSIHDVGPRFEGEIDRLIGAVSPHVPVERLTMLVVPDHWGEHPILPGSAFASRLRAWSDAGVSMFAHGWFHRDVATHFGRIASFRANHMTAGEGEFLGLDRKTAAQRMADGRALIEDVTGQPIAGFVAPAWLYGREALEALSEAGFPLAEDHMKVWDPRSGHVVARGPVITWASRSRTRIASSLLAARVLSPVMRFASIARVAVHPGDAHVPALLTSIDATLAQIRRSHEPGQYTALL